MPQLAGQSNSYQSFHVRSGKPCIIIVNTDIIINANNAVIFFAMLQEVMLVLRAIAYYQCGLNCNVYMCITSINYSIGRVLKIGYNSLILILLHAVTSY